MSTVLIARFKNKKEASKAAKMLKESGSQSIVTTGNDLEDMYLSRLIDEGMKKGGEVDTDEFLTELDERIAGKDWK